MHTDPARNSTAPKRQLRAAPRPSLHAGVSSPLGTLFAGLIAAAIVIALAAGTARSRTHLPARTESPTHFAQASDDAGWTVYLPTLMRQHERPSGNSPPIPTPIAPSDPPAPYCIQGLVFHDVDADGQRDDPATEPALSDFQIEIFLDRNGNAELDAGDAPPLETIITQDAVFRSVELEGGTYFVQASPPPAEPAWTPTQPQGPVMLTLSGPGGDFCEAVSFGFTHP